MTECGEGEKTEAIIWAIERGASADVPLGTARLTQDVAACCSQFESVGRRESEAGLLFSISFTGTMWDDPAASAPSLTLIPFSSSLTYRRLFFPPSSFTWPENAARCLAARIKKPLLLQVGFSTVSLVVSLTLVSLKTPRRFRFGRFCYVTAVWRALRRTATRLRSFSCGDFPFGSFECTFKETTLGRRGRASFSLSTPKWGAVNAAHRPRHFHCECRLNHRFV